MANLFVRSTDGNDADNGTTWALAKATLAGALAVAAAGDTIYVSDNHAETQASAMAITSPGTAANPCRILCVDDAGDPTSPTKLATTATVTVTGNFDMTFAGFAYCFGITFNCGSGASSGEIYFNSTSPWWWAMESCKCKFAGTSGTQTLKISFFGGGIDDCFLEFINTTVEFSGTNQSIENKGRFRWLGGSITGTIPTTLFNPVGGGFAANVEVIGVDLSAAGSGKNLVGAGDAGNGHFLFVDCKLGASVTLVSESIAGQGGIEVEFINCDSADTNYRYFKQRYQGTITQETSFYRTGGASDGATSFCRKMVSTANSKVYSGLELAWSHEWNQVVGIPVAVAMSIISFGASKLQDDEIWMEWEAMTTIGVPLGGFGHDRMATVLATPTDQEIDAKAWSAIAALNRANSTAYSLGNIIYVQGKLFSCTTAGTSASSEPAGYATAIDGDSVTDNTAVFRAGWRQRISSSFIPRKAGWYRARALLAEASQTVYVDPDVQSASSTLLTDLLAHWKLNELSGSRIDSSGRGNHLTDNNTVAQAAGKLDNAASFVTANSEYLSIPSNPDLTFDGDNVTFACWVYLNSKTNSMTILAKDDGSSTEYSLIYNQGTDRFVFQCATEIVSANNFGSPSTGTWYFIECYEDIAGEVIGIRVNNGTANEFGTGGVFIQAGTAQFRLGARNSGTPLYFDGRIDSVSVWQRLLTSAERTSLYAGGSGLDYPF